MYNKKHGIALTAFEGVIKLRRRGAQTSIWLFLDYRLPGRLTRPPRNAVINEASSMLCLIVNSMIWNDKNCPSESMCISRTGTSVSARRWGLQKQR